MIYDTAAANFGREMKLALVDKYGRNHGIQVKGARKDIVPGYQVDRSLLTQRHVEAVKQCALPKA